MSASPASQASHARAPVAPSATRPEQGTRNFADPAQVREALRATLRAIQAREPEIGAFACVADEQEALPGEGASPLQGPLAGLAVGVKDIFDTRDLPTAYGAPGIYPPGPARHDAAIVSALRRAGACVVGKTTTTEFAFLHPTATRNPRAPGRTPGGSSAGSAAAVAAGVIPLAVGTQTGGSVIRPASYCGVVGYKPTFGWLPTSGLKCFSWSLDTVGLFAGAVADMRGFAQALTGRALAAKQLRADRPLVVGVAVDYPWGAPAPDMQRALERATRTLREAGHAVRLLELPASAGAAFHAHADVQGWEAATALRWEWTHHRDALSAELRDYLVEAHAVTASGYERAQGVAAQAREELAQWLGGCDVLLTPSAPGQAPEGYASTGASTFNRMWTLLGWPCVSVPGLVGDHGAPVGMQLIGRMGEDARVLEAAGLLEQLLAPADGNRTAGAG
jgi:Asp-tRNA(Asn)/Glu-tRNA(Gln) amidotransferase A subunit family amidase